MSHPNLSPVPAGTTLGLAPNLEGALAYFLGPVTGILFLVLEKENSFVRFHAMQSTIFWVGWFVLGFGLSLLSAVPVLGWIVGLLLSLVLGFAGFVIWVLQMWRAFRGEEWEMPVAGAYARKQLGG